MYSLQGFFPTCLRINSLVYQHTQCSFMWISGLCAIDNRIFLFSPFSCFLFCYIRASQILKEGYRKRMGSPMLKRITPRPLDPKLRFDFRSKVVPDALSTLFLHRLDFYLYSKLMFFFLGNVEYSTSFHMCFCLIWWSTRTNFQINEVSHVIGWNFEES